ncbi:transposase [Clostridium ganghwense]|uniref:Transposase n=1 Tax=Clostridium ganghwense TaxID=312089 RepID=A0ABT4CPL8_9CLOT|nr:transposase [Clostridium ganghwense]MCY6371002.1 transposase [Clostridium ganghwense]
MPRSLRNTDIYGTNHIMNRGSSDTIIFENDKDKKVFLNIVKKAQKIYNFVLYSYCIMDTHFHLLIYSNGANISTYMKYIQQCFAIYYNKTYCRHGHVFADRFKSVPAKADCRLPISLAELNISAYIHNNPKDVQGYNSNMENYTYCSFGIYMGIKKDKLNILNTDYILSFFHSKNKGIARKKYRDFVYQFHNIEIKENIEFQSEPLKYHSDKKLLVNKFTPKQIIDFVSVYTGEDFCVHMKYNHKNFKMKSLCVILMRSVCGLTLKEISSILGNVTSSNVWKLCENGLTLINKEYKNIIDDFIKYNKIHCN